MENKILEIIKKYNLIENEDKIVVGVSGGPDSITLLNILKNIKESKYINFEIVVCHINHMIRQEAIEDEEYVKKYCKDIVCYYSDNDPYVKYDVEKAFADKLTDKQYVIKNGWHINEETGYTKFEEILKEI